MINIYENISSLCTRKGKDEKGKDEMQRGRKRVAVVVQRGLALLVHVLLELVLVEDHVDDLLLGQGVALPHLSSWETKQTF